MGAESLGEKNKGFKKKNRYKKQAQKNNFTGDKVFRGVGFKVGNEGPEMYAKTIKRK